MKNASKTPLFATLRKALQMALAANKAQTDADEVIQRADEARMTRRKFLENTGKTLAVGAVASLTGEGLLTQSLFKKPARIVIVGAGMAGLSALHTLRKANKDAVVYESSGRTGGRIFTVQEAMGPGTWTEFGGEFIDSNHADMWALASDKTLREQPLEMIDYAQTSENALTKEAFFFEGKHHTLAQLVEQFRLFADRIAADAAKLPDDISYKTKDPIVRNLDHLSLSEYLEKIGATGWVKRFIEVSYESEYGLSPQVQSAINLIWLISTDTEGGKFELFGESDERYKIKGGNQSITDALATKYASHIQLNRSLISLRQKGHLYELTFSGMKDPVTADFVILTIPFTRLRQIDLQIKKMPELKMRSIRELGYGTNAKLMMGMKTHYWRDQGYQALCYADNGIPNGWDNAQLQTPVDQTAGFSILFGGPSGIELGQGTPAQQRDIYLPKLEQIFPGAVAQHNGQLARMHWPTQPHTLCSYICYTTGQYTGIGGAEQMPVGRVFFAGEHCGGEFGGFMNGAAKSGREAAEAVLRRL